MREEIRRLLLTKRMEKIPKVVVGEIVKETAEKILREEEVGGRGIRELLVE